MLPALPAPAASRGLPGCCVVCHAAGAVCRDFRTSSLSPCYCERLECEHLAWIIPASPEPGQHPGAEQSGTRLPPPAVIGWVTLPCSRGQLKLPALETTAESPYRRTACREGRHCGVIQHPHMVWHLFNILTSHRYNEAFTQSPVSQAPWKKRPSRTVFCTPYF